MKEDGIHENFWAMPEMPWKRKEREMDNEFKRLVLRYLALITMALLFGKETIVEKDAEDLVKDVNIYVRKLG
jgi:hypothetical protein